MAKKDFTPATGKCVHVTIEAVFPTGDCREMEDTLEQLRQYGSAVVTKRAMIAEDFDAAHAILKRREAK